MIKHRETSNHIVPKWYERHCLRELGWKYDWRNRKWKHPFTRRNFDYFKKAVDTSNYLGCYDNIYDLACKADWEGGWVTF